MKRFLFAVLVVLALPAAAVQTGTAQTQATMFDAFCDQCGPAKASDLRNLVASVVFGTGGSVSQAITGTTITATTKFLAADGLNSAPTFAFTSAPTNGFYYPGSNTIRMANGGVATHVWDSATYYMQSDTGTIYMGASNDVVISRAAAGQLKFGPSATAATQLRAAQTTVPTCSSNCGTSPAVVGTDTAGIVTMGATGSPASGFVITFNGTWAAAPSCVVQSALTTMVVGKLPIAVQTATTTITVTTNGTAPGNSDKYSYVCFGVQ